MSLAQSPWAAVGRWIRQIKRHPSVAAAHRFTTHPHNIAGRQQRVQVTRLIVDDARGQNLTFQIRGDQCRALQNFNRIKQRIHPAARRGHPLPSAQKPCENRLFRWDNLAPASVPASSGALVATRQGHTIRDARRPGGSHPSNNRPCTCIARNTASASFKAIP